MSYELGKSSAKDRNNHGSDRNQHRSWSSGSEPDPLFTERTPGSPLGRGVGFIFTFRHVGEQESSGDVLLA